MVSAAPSFTYHEPFPLGEDTTVYRKLEVDPGLVQVRAWGDREMIEVKPEALALLANQAMKDCSFMLRTEHLTQVAAILDDPEASANDRGVALAMLRNAVISSRGILPFCQDTGTAIVFAKKGQQVWTGVDDAEWLSHGIWKTYQEENLRYSQTMPVSMFEEVNSGNNLPAQVDIMAAPGDAFKFLFVAKGGGSANKTFLYQETKALLNPKSFEKFVVDKMISLGTAACPPYHLVFVVGGTSAETCLKTVKLASTKYYDTLPTSGSRGGRAFRDLEMEQKVLKLAQQTGIGAQFGGKYYALDVRIVRLPRHGASCPVGVGVSCSADRNIKAKITRDGLFVEQLEVNPERFLPEQYRGVYQPKGHKIDLRRPMPEILAQLAKLPITSELALTGTIIVARDSAHAKFKERLDRGEGLPDYLKDHPVYYAGPAKTPAGYASGSFGPTTAGRMDSYVDLLQSHGGSMIMLAKGNRSDAVTAACQKHGGFYLGSIGGPAALLAQNHIKKMELIEYPELGMEAVYKIEVEDFPAFILVDNKGNDFFRKIRECPVCAT